MDLTPERAPFDCEVFSTEKHTSDLVYMTLNDLIYLDGAEVSILHTNFSLFKGNTYKITVIKNNHQIYAHSSEHVVVFARLTSEGNPNKHTRSGVMFGNIIYVVFKFHVLTSEEILIDGRMKRVPKEIIEFTYNHGTQMLTKYKDLQTYITASKISSVKLNTIMIGKTFKGHIWIEVYIPGFTKFWLPENNPDWDISPRKIAISNSVVLEHEIERVPYRLQMGPKLSKLQRIVSTTELPLSQLQKFIYIYSNKKRVLVDLQGGKDKHGVYVLTDIEFSDTLWNGEMLPEYERQIDSLPVEYDW